MISAADTEDCLANTARLAEPPEYAVTLRHCFTARDESIKSKLILQMNTERVIIPRGPSLKVFLYQKKIARSGISHCAMAQTTMSS